MPAHPPRVWSQSIGAASLALAFSKMTDLTSFTSNNLKAALAPALSMMTKLGSLALEREYLLSVSEQAGDLLSAGGTTIFGALTLHASLCLCFRSQVRPAGEAAYSKVKSTPGGSRFLWGAVFKKEFVPPGPVESPRWQSGPGL